MRKYRIHLTDEEYNVLQHITRTTHIDEWFRLDTDREGFDCVRNLDTGRKITLRTGVKWLCEGVDWMKAKDWHRLGVTENELGVFCNLCTKRLGIEFEILECPLGGDETDDCAGCTYAGDYHFVNGECVRREED